VKEQQQIQLLTSVGVMKVPLLAQLQQQQQQQEEVMDVVQLWRSCENARVIAQAHSSVLSEKLYTCVLLLVLFLVVWTLRVLVWVRLPLVLAHVKQLKQQNQQQQQKAAAATAAHVMHSKKSNSNRNRSNGNVPVSDDSVSDMRGKLSVSADDETVCDVADGVDAVIGVSWKHW